MPELREQVWSIAHDPSEDGFVVTAFDSEAAFFEQGSARTGLPIPLAALMELTDPTTPRWSRRRVPSTESGRIGQQLWNALPPPLRWSIRPQPGQPLQLGIATDVAAVADLPWEWLSDGSPVALRPDVRLVRSVPSRMPVPSLSVELPMRVLLLVSNAKDERLLIASTEISAVTGRLRPPNYELRVVEDASLEAMTAQLTGWLPHVVHYIGHGGLTHGEGNLIFNGYDGRSRWVGATELSRLLPSTVRLLCLSTCFTTRNYQLLGLSHLGRASGLVDLPTTLTNQFPVDEPAVRAFWDTFYGALIEYAGSATEAVHRARVAAAAVDPDSTDWSSFSLAVRDQDGVPFAIGRTSADPGKRRSIELRAQLAAQLVNELATQVAVLGDDAPAGLREQFEREQSRTAGLLDELAQEG